MDLRTSVAEAIGNTPLVRLGTMTAGLPATVAVKLEYFNPAGSIKDRAALSMITAAERNGSLRPGGTVVEATSGNTGAALAMIAASRGYRTVIVCTDTVPDEKTAKLEAFGATVVTVPANAEPGSPEHYLSTAQRIADGTENAVFANQGFNPANPDGHYRTTGPEIWRQTDGHITVYVTSAGTGGTATGAGRYLKEQDPDIEVVVADPVGSIFGTYVETGVIGTPSDYLVEAAGQNQPFIPTTFDPAVIDRVVQVGDVDSLTTARALARTEGIFAGMSGGLAVAAALRIAREKTVDDLIVAVIPDAGDKYLPRLYSEAWLAEHLPAVLDHEASDSQAARERSPQPQTPSPTNHFDTQHR